MTIATVRLIDPLKNDSPATDAVWNILCEVDEEFVPPLSDRKGPKDTQFESSSSGKKAPTIYFESVLEQPVFVVEENEVIVGFMVFFRDYVVPETGRPAGFYVSTIGITQKARRKGYARKLYDHLLAYASADKVRQDVMTRTWSENQGHLALLKELGFVCTAEVPDARGPGIATVVYRLETL